jgi:hypothetical protein
MRWSLSNSISVIPGAPVLATVNVTGPAATLVVSSAQPSFPPLLAIVTLTAFVPLDCAFGGLDWLLEWPHAVTGKTATAARTVVVNQNSRDRHAALAV